MVRLPFWNDIRFNLGALPTETATSKNVDELLGEAIAHLKVLTEY